MAVADGTVGVVLLTATGPPMSVDTSFAAPIGPRRWNCTVPLQVVTPVTVTVAESLTETDPVPIEVVPPETLCCVVTDEPQVPKPPRMKSFSVAVVDVDDLVSDDTDEKHLSPSPSAVRLTPPSKNSPLSAPLFGVPLLSANGHGIVIVLALTMPQNWSFAAAPAQLALVDVPLIRRFASPHVPAVLPVVLVQVVSHAYTVIVDVVPPLLKSVTTNTSPFLCTPVNPVPPPTLPPLSPIEFWKNQNPCCASPLLSKRSEPKYSTSPAAVEYRAAKLCRRLSLSGRPPALLPRPLVDVLRVLGAAAGEDAGVVVRFGHPVHRRRAA